MRNCKNAVGDQGGRSSLAYGLTILLVLAMGALSMSPLDAKVRSAQGNAIKTCIAKAKALSDEGRFQEALTLLEQAVKTAVSKPERDELRIAMADTHISWAASLGKNYENAAAIEEYKAALDIDKEIRPTSAASVLNNIGMVYSDLGEKKKALEFYEQALPIWRAFVDRTGEATTISNIGVMYSDLGEKKKALDYYEQALPIWRAIVDRRGEAVTLNNLGQAYSDLGEKKKALDYYEQALPVLRAVGDRADEATTLANIGTVYSDLGEKRKALEYFEQALPIRRAVGDRTGEATTLSNIGGVYSDLGEKRKALEYCEQALPILRAVGDRAGEAMTLSNIGGVYSDLGENKKAQESYEQALSLRRAVGDRRGEATMLSNIGVVYSDLGENRKALESYEQALPVLRAVGDRRGEATTLSNIGVVYSDLGENRKALEYFEQALPVLRAVGDRAVEATTLTNIGAVYSELGDKRKALESYGQALPLRRAVGDRRGEATTLSNIGMAYSDIGEKRKALEYYEQALLISRAVGDRTQEAMTLNNIGAVYYALGEIRKALEYDEQALPISRAAGNRSGEALKLSNMMQALKALSEPGLAIFYGKQAVNLYQRLRADIQGLDKELQKTYAKTVEGTYRGLADLLISRSRLPEAQQVLNLLKQEEYFDFVRRDAGEASSLNARATLTAAEADSENRYAAVVDKVAELGLRHGNLAIKQSRTAEEEAELKRLDSDLEAAGHAFQAFLDNLAEEFKAVSPGRDPVAQIREAQGLAEDLGELGSGTVAIYTLVGEEKTRIVLITPDIQIGREFPITRGNLALKVWAFREALQDPEKDPRPLGQELYGILVEPIAKDLVQAGARTLMWSLDGVLRYLPIAALYDGQGYFLERYRNVVFTPASNARLKDLPAAHWQGLGLGVSKEHEGFKPLPAVPAELHGIFQEGPKYPGGIVLGNALLDEDFTAESMRAALRKRIPLVHIASHFQFAPGNERDSFLLLGDGSHFSLDKVRASSNLFGGVELLTLSACETAMGGEGEGTEVEGFAVLAQRQGAKAVIASLWSIADASTSLLMREFYRVREATPGMSKAEALRQAQLALLEGRIKPVIIKGASNPVESYAHPYYWAPFILIGNWR
jgi:CHAT domain-containing protein/Tfp pilus assembly protein PilF